VELKELSATVFERAALDISTGYKTWACMAVDDRVGRYRSTHRRAFEYYFGPKDKRGAVIERPYCTSNCKWRWGGNIKYAPRAVRNHPFWDRSASTEKLREERVMALLTMAAMVEAAKA
jgi:hypothetical protein